MFFLEDLLENFESPSLVSLVLRLAVGAAILEKGAMKFLELFNNMAAQGAAFSNEIGTFLFVGFLEVLLPAFLVLGFWTRFAALGIAIFMGLKSLAMPPAMLASLAETTLTLNLSFALFIASTMVFFLGSGRFALMRS